MQERDVIGPLKGLMEDTVFISPLLTNKFNLVRHIRSMFFLFETNKTSMSSISINFLFENK